MIDNTSRGSWLVATCSVLLGLVGLHAEDASIVKPPLLEPVKIMDKERPPQLPAKLTLDEILKGWIQKAALIERLDAEYSRIIYDDTFDTVKYGNGRVAVDWIGRGFLIQAAAKDITHETVKWGSRNYHAVALGTEHWHWTGTHVFRIDDASHTFERLEKPVELQYHVDRPRAPELLEPNLLPNRANSNRRSASWFTWVPEEFWLARPFLLGMPLDEMRQRYQIKLIEYPGDHIRLEFVPRMASDLSQYSQAQLILSRDTFEPRAMQVISPTRETRAVYVFKNVRINCSSSEPFSDLEHPNLEGYRSQTRMRN